MKLKGLKHSEAAAVLSNANGEIVLEVQFLIPDYHKITDENEKIKVAPETSESTEAQFTDALVDDTMELETAKTETTEIGTNEDESAHN